MVERVKAWKESRLKKRARTRKQNKWRGKKIEMDSEKRKAAGKREDSQLSRYTRNFVLAISIQLRFNIT